MTVLHLLSYAAAVVAFLFVTLSLASGLLWLSEVIEEHSRSAKSIGKRGIYAIIAIHVILYFSESLPLPGVIFGIFCHIVYLQNFSHTWPFISLTSLSFMASCVLVIIDHFIWFFHFARSANEARQPNRNFRGVPMHKGPTFGDMATFFGLCVWLAPLFLFLSLSANDNALPTASGVPASPSAPAHTIPVPRARTSLFRSVLDALPLDYLPRMRSRRNASDGIIAPPSPGPIPPPSPTHSLHSFAVPRTPTRASSYSEFQDAASRGRLTPDFALTPPPRRMSATGGSPALSPLINRRRL
ncbi:DUF396-domain-containing protein [Artomyces pyxidatus]|uniref:DUF396-domain-containing protein n=1 Tax=Artomyces pyxidatus TaxID=48021 RepID=A0ACB8TBZ4_9AGAM|nr:DUF396-domain-containing protein [Artomyces pyxidatus]